MNSPQLSLAIVIGLMIGAQAAPAARPVPPTRDPSTPGYVTARELPDGALPPPEADGNFIIGPTHNPAPEMAVQDGVPQGTVYNFTMSSADSKIYPGIARDAGTFGAVDPADPAKLVVTTSHPAPYTRRVAVYVPRQYVPGSVAPFIVGADGPDQTLFTALDNLIAQKRVPVMVAISIGNGSGDAQGSQRGLEYDTMSGRYAEFVETEVLPLVEKQYYVRLSRDPEARATMGGSSGGSAALIMAWYHPERYHRVLTYSLTAVNQQWPPSAETPHGAWEFHDRLIPDSPAKPIRIWMEVGDRDLLNPNVMRDNMHDWVVANENMARVLAAKGYHYQFVFARNAGHSDRAVKQQTLPEALEWLWKGYPIEGVNPAPVTWTFDHLDTIGGLATRVEGNPKVIDTPVGRAIEFDGIDDALWIERHPLAGAETFTFEVVFRPDGGATEQRWFHLAERDPKTGSLAGTGTPDTNSRFLFELRVVNGTQWYLDAFVHGPGYSKPLMFPDKLHPIGQWYHVAQTFDGKTFRSYVDGELQGEAEIAFKPQGEGAASVGARINRTSYFRGAVRQARFTRAALPPDQFMKLAHQERP
jgi:enterochelin esterase-like enzyme